MTEVDMEFLGVLPALQGEIAGHFQHSGFRLP